MKYGLFINVFIHPWVKHFMVSIMGALNTQDGLDLILPLWSSWSRKIQIGRHHELHSLGLRKQGAGGGQ